MRICCVLAALAACSSDIPDYTLGARGRVEFALHPAANPIGAECFISCGVQWPLLVGTTEEIWATNHDVIANSNERMRFPGVRAASSDPSVLAVTESPCCQAAGQANSGCGTLDDYRQCIAGGGQPTADFIIHVAAVGEGSAHLVIYSDDDPVYDQLVVEAKRPASLDFQALHGTSFESHRSLELGAVHQTVRAVARDEGGNMLFATNGITLSLAGSAAAFYGKYTTTTPQLYSTAYSELWRMNSGSDTLVLTAGDHTLAIPIR